MKKQTKVLVAAAMLTLGASFSAMAAEKGTWQYEAGEWYCYDADGDVYEEAWCLSDDGSKEYWVGEDGVMVTSDWVDEGTYYVNSEGLKAKGEWRRLLPFDADEDAEAESFYFGSNGKKSTGKKVIDGNTYYFDKDGILLTGWVNTTDSDDIKAADEGELVKDASVVYTIEEGEFRGARLATDWVKTWAPGADKDEDDQYWYYIDSKGKATFGKKSNIKGATYFFGTNAQMLSGWVALDGANYKEIGTEDQAADLSTFGDVYFCGGADDGHAQKNKWIKEYNIKDYYEKDADDSTYWFWLEKDGRVFKSDSELPLVASAADATTVTFLDGEEEIADAFSYSTSKFDAYLKKIDGKVYIFNANGEMKSGLINMNGEHYYFGAGSDGARKDGAQTLADDYGVEYKFFFADADDDDDYEDYAGVTGAAGGKLYNKGLLVTSEDAKYAVVEVDGKNYIVNKSGSIQTSTKVYKDGDDVVYDVEAEGTSFAGDTYEPHEGSIVAAADAE